MVDSSQSIFDKAYSPVLQAAVALGMVVFFTILSKMLSAVGLIEIDVLFPWSIAATFMLCYALFNSIFSLAAPDMNKYWSRSMLSYAGLVICSGLVAYLFSSTSISNAATYKWIFFVLTFGYLVFLSIVRFMKNIVQFAEREEWHQPRERKRKSKP